MKAQYAILRFAKYKGPEIGNIEAHNERTKEKYASNPDVVAVDENGQLTGVAEGEAQITVSVADNPAVSAKAQVKVEQVSADTGVALSHHPALHRFAGICPGAVCLDDRHAFGTRTDTLQQRNGLSRCHQ